MPVRFPVQERGCVGNGKTEIDQLDVLISVDQEITGIDVVMDKTTRMHGRKSLGCLGKQFDLLGGTGRARLANILKADAVDILHHQVVLSLDGGAILQGANDMWMHKMYRHLTFGRSRLTGGRP